MKALRPAIHWFLPLALAAGCGDGDGEHFIAGSAQNQVVNGSGVLAEEARAVSGFTAVVHRTEGDLFIEQAPAALRARVALHFKTPKGTLRAVSQNGLRGPGGREALIVRAEDNLLPYLITEVVDGVLELRTEDGVELNPTRPIEFLLRVDSLERIELLGVGSISAGYLESTNLNVVSGGVGSIELARLITGQLDVALSGVGGVRVSGLADLQTVRLSGIGSYVAPEMQSPQADVLVSGTGSVIIHATELLIAEVQSSGSVLYLGDPELQTTISGSGTIEPWVP